MNRLWKLLGWSYCEKHQRWYKSGHWYRRRMNPEPVCSHCWSEKLTTIGEGFASDSVSHGHSTPHSVKREE